MSLLGVGTASAQGSAPTERAAPSTAVPIAPQVQAAPADVQTQVRRAVRGDDLEGKDGPMAKVGSDLATLYYQHEAEGAAGVQRLLGGTQRTRRARNARYHSPVSPDGQSVAINAVAVGEAADLRRDLRTLGLEGGATAGRVVSGRLPISALKNAAKLRSLRGLMPAYAQTHVGSVGSEADTSHRAYQGRSDLGADGSGQKVCVLSDSYNQNNSASTSASDDVQSGDLPGADNPEGNTTPVDVLDDSEPGDDEGRAMLQLVHDIAPRATLGFHTAFGGIANFASGIQELADAGCTVIVDDVKYFVEPFYQDGPVSNAVDDVVDSDGVAYFSSAGNSGQNSYEAPFRNSGEPGVISSSSVAHDFDSTATTDTRQEITVEAGGTLQVIFQWTDPSALVEGSTGANTDFDIALVSESDSVVAQSADDNISNGLPFEFFEYTNDDGSAKTLFLAIEQAAETGADTDRLKYIYIGSGPFTNSDVTINEYDTLGPTIFGHPMAEGAMAVAAAPFFDTEAFDGADPARLESFSSKGGIKIRFDENGVPLPSPEDREKPDVTGTDAVDNTFFGSDIGFKDPDPHPNFFGTSAAAPNVAAIAALIREVNPGFTPTEVYNQLESNAEDVTLRQNRDGGSEPVSAGRDPWSGHGFVQATAAALPVELARFDAVVEGETAVLTWTTASETNNAGFGIEHRRGDGAFETMAFRDGAGTTSASQTYRYRTPALAPGTHTFRLRQEDLDGSATYSDERTVERTLSDAYSVSPVSPNPVSDEATVSVAVQEAQDVRVGVFNVLGQRVARLHDGPVAANDPTTLTVGTDLQSGVYFLRIKGDSFSATRKFVRVR
ncbi:MAG: hypothetical protein BRD31_03020 [Bacteroidetes bacterium QH_2_64_26]|nr:MAG: hypothetical protein BRD31_03020 [Bacteroidetes bacterium QH_2_64_26]